MNTLSTHEICAVAGGDFPIDMPLYYPIVQERMLPAPTSPMGIPVPPERWPICPIAPEVSSAY